MNKILKVGILGFVFAFALTTSAATFSNVKFDNGDVTISGQGGSTVNATFRLVVPANQVVEYIQTDVIGDSLAPVCTSVGGELGLQEGTHENVTLAIKLPPNTGTYNLQVQGAGIYGGIRAVDCNDNVVATATTFTGAVRTTTSGTGGTTGGTDKPSWLDSFLAAITAIIKPTPAPTTGAACTTLATKLVGTQDGVYNEANVKLQGFLLSEGMSIPALKAGASFGFKGSQTNAALAQYKAINNCQ